MAADIDSSLRWFGEMYQNICQNVDGSSIINIEYISVPNGIAYGININYCTPPPV